MMQNDIPRDLPAKGTIRFTGTEPEDPATLVDVLDHVLTQGAMIRGNLVISLAGVDLIYLGLDVILTSIETALKHMATEAGAPKRG